MTDWFYKLHKLLKSWLLPGVRVKTLFLCKSAYVFGYVCLYVCVFMRVHKLSGDSLLTDVNRRSLWHIQSHLSTVMEKRTLTDICCVCQCVSMPVYACMKHTVPEWGRWEVEGWEERTCPTLLTNVEYICVYICVSLCAHINAWEYALYMSYASSILKHFPWSTSPMTPTHSWSHTAEELLVDHYLTSNSSWLHSGCVLLYHAACNQLIAI